jgi:hypothetical protein
MMTTTMMSPATFDRFDIVSAHHLFWSEHHDGQFSRGYERLSKISAMRFDPGVLFAGWNSLSDNAKEIYRNLCITEDEQCEYDTLKFIVDDAFDWVNDTCVEWFIDQYNDDPEALSNYDHSDFVNIDMCYTKDLLNFYECNTDCILHWVDEACSAYGYTSRLQLVEGQTIEDPDDFATALVNAGMTYLGITLWQTAEERRG